MQKITPFLWFDNNAEEAMDFYIDVFNGKGSNETKVLFKSPGPDGKMITGSFMLNGQEFMVLNAGPQFKFNEAISIFVNCDTQEEVDELWDKLVANGGEESMCGWLKDKYGLSWQIIPKQLGEYLGSENRERAGRAMQAMLKMKKIIIKDLQTAYDGE
jgi:predicted 3-demethylubiquinone-9 3-methyltransferase (glyoxalase superfamily)